ncbi:transport protein Trs120 or TRAPPC9 TRAPP II complex subunit-domain-containing protein [Russula earlei]|uniref:Transport protein Trs120 or TRAPPC9 TRAPP II complex subunit-domain-containing protein n=1 Tax=Russula earlei TaxID=71964 RepID=A0ACC0U6X9_9AGAM|nr:transport protein Trs120 or TRAPPC9 TRAPP II complex subunit-domain-containing protein [Russula earlei]
MEFSAFASLAHFRILLLPVGSIPRTTFDQWAAVIRTLDSLRLSDIPPGTKDEKARFMPSPKSIGYLHLCFPTHPPSLSQYTMSLFRPSHFPLGVIGIASCSQTDSVSSILTEFKTAVKDLFPPDSLYPLAKSCFVFEEGDGTTNLNLGDHLPGLVIIPSMMGNKKENIETLLADLCSNILAEFSTVVNTLESSLGNEYLNASLFPSLPSASDLPMPLVNEEREPLARLPSHNSQPELSAGVFRKGTPPISGVKRNPSTAVGSPIRQSSLGVATVRKRHSFIGAASSHGRLFKVLGDLFLLAGRTDDASVWYTEAVALFKTANDPVWYASSLEGLATVALLEAWSGQGFNTSPSAGREPWSDISEKLEQAILLYAKPGPLSETDQRYDLLAYLYTVANLRQSFLLFATWAAKGWGPLTFTALMHPGPAPYIPPTLTHPISLIPSNRDRLSSISGVTRSQIAAAISQVHGPWFLHLGHRERIVVLENIACLYSSLGYHRKEAYILREVVGCIMDLVVCAREEYGPTYPSKPTPNGLSDSGTVATKGIEIPTGNESVLKIVKYICEVHGVNLEAVRFVNTTARSTPEGEGVPQDTSLDDLPEDPYGWPELQLGIIREALAVAESLPDPPSVAQFSFSVLKTLHSLLSDDDQYHMYHTSIKALSAAKRRGDARLLDYWSGRPLVSVELLRLPPTRSLVESPISSLAQRRSEDASRLTHSTGPFLYNPRRSVTTTGSTPVVKGEPLEFALTLYNPFVFDLEIQSLSLSTSGVAFDTKPIQVTIPSNSYHSVTISGHPLEEGSLVIKGCHVQAPGGASREFLLPLETAEEEEHRLRRRSLAACEGGRAKYGGLDSRPGKFKRNSILTTSSSSRRTISRYLECSVVPEQPLLRIRWSSLTHGAVMLYDGEISTLRLTLENISNLPIDLLRLTFDDSTIAPAQVALAEGDLSIFDTYETEYQLINRPAFSWDREQEDTEILPQRKVTIPVACNGKVGCTSGCIFISYGYLHRPQSDLPRPNETFHTRQVSYPVSVTVYHMLECHNMDIFPISVGYHHEDEGMTVNKRRLLFKDVEERGWCLFSIDVRNTYGSPFEVTLERVQKDVPSISTSSIVAPGATTRCVSFERTLTRPPSAGAQQDGFASQENPATRRSSLLRRSLCCLTVSLWSRKRSYRQRRTSYSVSCSGTEKSCSKAFMGTGERRMGVGWVNYHSGNSGITLPMLETLRTDSAHIHLELFCRDDKAAEGRLLIPRKGGAYYPVPYDFVYLRIRVTNLSLQPLALTVDTIIDPPEHALQEGTPLGKPVGRLESGAERELETAICFVACGQFRIHVEARASGAATRDAKAGSATLKVVVREDNPP